LKNLRNLEVEPRIPVLYQQWLRQDPEKDQRQLQVQEEERLAGEEDFV